MKKIVVYRLTIFQHKDADPLVAKFVTYKELLEYMGVVENLLGVDFLVVDAQEMEVNDEL